MSVSNKYKFIILIILSFAIHCLASNFSAGFYSQDEHFQILSPVEFLLGINDNLYEEIWEFSDEFKIRSWFQSYIYFYIIKILQFLKFENPFIWIFTIKFLFSFLGVFVFILFYLNFKNRLFIDNNFNRIFILLFCFYPFFHSRTSSENLGMTFFLIGILFFDLILKLKRNNKKFYYELLAGIFLGLAIITRYQILIFVFAIYLWVFIYSLNYNNIKSLIVIGFNIIFILVLGLVFDFFGYQEINITYYNYFYTNFISGMLDNFGRDPWWFYFLEIPKSFFPPIGLLFIIAFIYLVYKKYNNLIIFISFFYFLIFIFIGHKELRFLFPLLFFSPFFICAFLDSFIQYKLTKFIKTLIFFFNFLFLIIFSLIPATEQVSLYKYIYKNKNNLSNIYYEEDNPYFVAGLNPKLYTHYLPKIKKINDYNKDDYFHLITRDQSKVKSLLNIKCVKSYSVYPDFIYINPNWKKHKFNWFFYNCSRQK